MHPGNIQPSSAPGGNITLPHQLFGRLTALTANNDHGECYLVAAQALGLTSVVDELQVINYHHRRLGYLRSDYLAKREVVYQNMLRAARMRLSPRQYKHLYCCF